MVVCFFRNGKNTPSTSPPFKQAISLLMGKPVRKKKYGD